MFVRKSFLLTFLTLLLLLTGCSSVDKKSLDEKVSAAIVTDNVVVLNNAINNGFNINQKLKNGDDLLTLALKENSIQVISYLLAKGVDVGSDVSQWKINGIDEIVSARPQIFYVNSDTALKILLSYGANPNSFTSEGDFLLNYYMKTKPPKLAMILINSGADLNILDSSSWYPIFWAVDIENVDIVRLMLKSDGKQYQLKDKKGNYPIYYANSKEVIETLLMAGNYNVSEKNIYGENILGEVYLKAKKMGYNDLLPILIKKGVNPNYKAYK